MEVDWIFAVLVSASFLAAAFNAAFSIGGAIIILATTSTLLPVMAVVPLHSGLLIGSSFSRMLMFWQYIRWDIAGPFLLGSVVGTGLGAGIYFELPEQVIAIAIAVVMLIAIWLPEISWRPRIRHPWAIVGFFHSLLSTLFAYGAILHAVALHAGMSRRQIVATLAGCLSGMSVFKIAGYAWYGFDFRPYLLLILASVLASLVGTWVGKRLSESLPEDRFRMIYRTLITITALRLMYTALTGRVG